MTDGKYGVCGVYCGQCPNGNGRVRFTAGELKRLVDTVRYEWMNEVVKSFSFTSSGGAWNGSLRPSAGAASQVAAPRAGTGPVSRGRGLGAACSATPT